MKNAVKRDLGLGIRGGGKACSTKLETLDAAKEQGLTLLDDMSGHPGMVGYHGQNFEIITNYPEPPTLIWYRYVQ